MATAVRVTGLRETISALKAVDVGLPRELRAAGLEAAHPVAEDARRRAPVLGGDLAASIRVGASQRGAVIRAGSASVLYAGPIHWGWPLHHIRAQPFLADAAEADATAVAAVYGRRVGDLLRSAGF